MKTTAHPLSYLAFVELSRAVGDTDSDLAKIELDEEGIAGSYIEVNISTGA